MRFTNQDSRAKIQSSDRLASLRGTKPAYRMEGNLLNALKAVDKEGEVGLDEVLGGKRDNANGVKL